MAKILRLSVIMDLLPLKLSDKEGRPQRPDMWRESRIKQYAKAPYSTGGTQNA